MTSTTTKISHPDGTVIETTTTSGGPSTPSDDTLVTGYWGIRGLGAPMRMMCAYAGVKVKDILYGAPDAPDWFKADKPPLLEQNGYINLPYVKNTETGLIVTQSTAVYQYLGRCFGLAGTSEAEVVAVEQTLAQAFDLRNSLMNLVYPFSGIKTREEYEAALPKHLEEAAGHYTKFAAFLGDKPYTVGDQPTAGDFHLWEMLDQHEMMAAEMKLASPLAAFPTLKAFHARFAALPQLAGYFASPAAKLPVNSPAVPAHFK